MMRTTLDLPDDLHRIVVSIATHGRTSLSHTAAELIRRGLASSAGAANAATYTLHPLSGLPVLAFSRPISPEDVKALEDDS